MKKTDYSDAMFKEFENEKQAWFALQLYETAFMKEYKKITGTELPRHLRVLIWHIKDAAFKVGSDIDKLVYQVGVLETTRRAEVVEKWEEGNA